MIIFSILWVSFWVINWFICFLVMFLCRKLVIWVFILYNFFVFCRNFGLIFLLMLIKRKFLCFRCFCLFSSFSVWISFWKFVCIFYVLIFWRSNLRFVTRLESVVDLVFRESMVKAVEMFLGEKMRFFLWYLIDRVSNNL